MIHSVKRLVLTSFTFQQWLAYMILFTVPFSSLVGLGVTFVDATSFVYGDDLTCSSPVTVTANDISCGNNSSYICNWGDTITASVSVTFEEALSTSEVCVTTKVCLNGYNWLCKTFHYNQFDICNDLQLQSVDGQTCPNAGTYLYSKSIPTPKLSNFTLTLGSGWWALATMSVTDCSNSTTSLSFDCVASIHSVASYSSSRSTSRSSSSSTNSAYLTGGMLAGVSALTFILVRTRRNVERIRRRRQEESFMEPKSTGNFEIMMDSVRV